MALNALLTSNSEQAVPMLEKFLSSGASPKLRNRALFILTQSGSPRGRAMVADIARGKSHPDLQRTAVKYLGLFGGRGEPEDPVRDLCLHRRRGVKKAVLQAYMTSGNKAGVLAAARGEKSPEMRRAAIRQLGPMGATAELWELYRTDPSTEARKDIIQGLFVGGGRRPHRRAGEDGDEPGAAPDGRAHARPAWDEEQTGATLVAFYQSDPDPEVRREALRGLFIQGNAHAARPARAGGEGPRHAPGDRAAALADGREQGSDGLPHGDPEQVSAPRPRAHRSCSSSRRCPPLAAPPPRLVRTPVRRAIGGRGRLREDGRARMGGRADRAGLARLRGAGRRPPRDVLLRILGRRPRPDRGGGCRIEEHGSFYDARRRTSESATMDEETAVILLRAEQGRIGRVRVVSRGCGIDAGGRTLTWVDDVKPAESLAPAVLAGRVARRGSRPRQA